MDQKRHQLRQMRFLKRLPIGYMFIVIALLTVAIAVVWIGLAPSFLDLASLTDDQWSELSTSTSVAALAFGLGAGVLALVQLTEAADSRNLGIYRDIYEKLMDDDEIEARRYLYQQIDLPANADGAAIRTVLDDAQTRQYLKRTLNLLDYFGFLVEQDWVTANEVVGWLSPVVVKVWAKIGPLVEYERKLRPEEPDYYISAVRLAKLCQQRRDKELPGREKRIRFDKNRL